MKSSKYTKSGQFVGPIELQFTILSMLFGMLIEYFSLGWVHNEDGHISIYGAKYMAENLAPIYTPHSGNDAIGAFFTLLAGSAQDGISLLALVLNGIAGAIAYISARKLNLTYAYSFAISICTTCLFMPPLGLWVGDHLGIIVGVLPFFFLITAEFFCGRRYWIYKTSIVYSIAQLPILLLFKINSSLPAGFSCLAGVIAYSIYTCKPPSKSQNNKLNLLKYIAIGLSIGLGILVAMKAGFTLVPFDDLKDFYISAFQAKAGEKVSRSNILNLPLNVDLIGAIINKNEHVLAYFPLILLWWMALINSIYSFYKSKNRSGRGMYILIIFFLAASALSAFTLGRGHTHKVIFSSLGVLLWISAKVDNNKVSKTARKTILGGLLAYLLAIFGVGMFKEHSILNQSTLRRKGNAAELNACDLSQKLGIKSNNGECFTRQDWQNKVAGIGGHGAVLGVANYLDINWANEGNLSERFHEEQNNSLTTIQGQEVWAEKSVQSIKKGNYEYYVEGFYNPSDKKQTGEFALMHISKSLNSCIVGREKSITAWRTNCQTKQLLK